jgi:hypothetical protein
VPSDSLINTWAKLLPDFEVFFIEPATHAFDQ